jgi:hypothetical protein
MVIILGVYESTITSQVIRVSNPQSFTDVTQLPQNGYTLIYENNATNIYDIGPCTSNKSSMYCDNLEFNETTIRLQPYSKNETKLGYRRLFQNASEFGSLAYYDSDQRPLKQFETIKERFGHKDDCFRFNFRQVNNATFNEARIYWFFTGPTMKHFAKRMQRMVESGFPKFWENVHERAQELILNIQLSNSNAPIKTEEDREKERVEELRKNMIRLKNLKPLFTTCFAFLSFAFVVFLVEVGVKADWKKHFIAMRKHMGAFYEWARRKWRKVRCMRSNKVTPAVTFIMVQPRESSAGESRITIDSIEEERQDSGGERSISNEIRPIEEEEVEVLLPEHNPWIRSTTDLTPTTFLFLNQLNLPFYYDPDPYTGPM